MPSTIRKDIDNSAGHCFNPRPPNTGSPNVFINNKESTRSQQTECAETQAVTDGCGGGIYDHYPFHSCPGSPPHDGCAEDGSPNVFVNCQPIHRHGDSISCGDVANNGSPDVFANSAIGTSYMVDNTVPYTLFEDTFVTPPTGVQKEATPFEAYIYTHDDEESSAEEISAPIPMLLPPLTTLGSFKVPNPIETDLVAPPIVTTPVHTCLDVENLPAGWRWQDDECIGTDTPPICNPTELNDFWPGFAAGFQLSTNFTLWDVTSGPAVSTYKLDDNVGLTQKEILQNLCFLAEIILEPMLLNYGPFVITSGFRLKSGGSQHNRGQAIDIQFPGFTGQQYWDLAQDIKNNINFDQFILEYSGINPWVHISVNPILHRHDVKTQTSPNTYEAGLVRII